MVSKHKINRRIELFPKSDLDAYPTFQPEKDYERLFESIQKDKLVVFFGAGVSRLAGCGSWRGLAVNIVQSFPNDVFSMQEKMILIEMASKDARRVISICYTRTKVRKDLLEIYYDAIKKSVTPHSNKKNLFKDIHMKLLHLKAISYITTNIDMGMETTEKVVRSSAKIYDLTSDIFDPTRDLRNGNIFYLHGSKNHIEKTIFTVNNYYEYYAGDKPESHLVSTF